MRETFCKIEGFM
jgi:hypothetical protein